MNRKIQKNQASRFSTRLCFIRHFSLQAQCIRARDRLGVQSRGLADSNHTMADARLVVVVGGSVVYRAVIKDSKIIDLPFDTALEVVVVGDHGHQEVLNPLALRGGQTIDLLEMVTHPKDGFPAGDGVGAHHGMLGVQALVNVAGVPAGDLIQVGDLWIRLVPDGRESAGEGLQPGAEGRREAVVYLVRAGKDRITTGRGAGAADQAGIVGSNTLKRDVGVPAVGNALLLELLLAGCLDDAGLLGKHLGWVAGNGGHFQIWLFALFVNGVIAVENEY